MVSEGAPRVQSQRDTDLVDRILRDFAQHRTNRYTFESHWEEVAQLVLPTSRGTFTAQSYTTPGEKKTDKQVDASGMMALHRFAAICDSLLTPRNMKWHGLMADDDYVMKDRQTKLWFEDTTRKLFKYRYAPIANFSAQNQGVYISLGAFGTGPMFVDKFDDPKIRGLRYRHIPLGEIYLIENHQGLVIGFFRFFRLTAAQAKMQWPDTFPEELKAALESGSQAKHDFLHYVCLRTADDYDEERLDARGKKYASCYVSFTGRVLLSEGGYNSLPLTASRYEQTPNEIYGRSPAMMVLPALKTLNAEKRTFLKQGHRAADPVLLTSDDGLIDLSLRPGAINKGGMTADGKPLIGVLPTGEIQISKEMMAEEKALINDAFLVSLFQILTETPQMTATEVIERTNEKGILLAPTVGRQQSEYLGPLVDRELDLLAEQGLLLPMPPRLKEAAGAYQVVYTSPLSRAMRAQEASGFMRSVEHTRELAAITQDPSLLDVYDFDVASPEIAEINGVPASWMSSADKIKAKREARAKVQAAQQQAQLAPGQAALMSAAAKQAQAGLLPANGQRVQ